MKSYEQIAEKMYDAYSAQGGGVAFDGKPLPTYAELGANRQACWIAAAKAAHEEFKEVM